MQKFLISIIVAGVLASGIWYIVGYSNNGESVVSDRSLETDGRSGDVMTETSDKNLPTGMSSLSDLANLGEAGRCEFGSTIDDVVTNGVFYTDGEKYRIEMTTVMDGYTETSNSIFSKEYTYMWTDNDYGQTGIIMKNQNMEAVTETEPVTQNMPTSFDMQQSVTYDCESWSVDPGVFVPPNDVEFVDMEAMSQGQFTLPTNY